MDELLWGLFHKQFLIKYQHDLMQILIKWFLHNTWQWYSHDMCNIGSNVMAKSGMASANSFQYVNC